MMPKLLEHRLTEIDGIKIPAKAGGLPHAILCSLIYHSDQFCSWEKIHQETELYLRQYGGMEAVLLLQKHNPLSQIKLYISSLLRMGTDSNAYHLHERGMGIYMFVDGAKLLTKGKIRKVQKGYSLNFGDGVKLQHPDGINFTFKEFKKFVTLRLITESGRILDSKRIAQIREINQLTDNQELEIDIQLRKKSRKVLDGLRTLGLTITRIEKYQIYGKVVAQLFEPLQSDINIKNIQFKLIVPSSESHAKV